MISAASATRTPVSRNSRRMAASRRSVKSRPSQAFSSRRRELLPALQLVGDEGPHVVPGDRLDRQRVATLGQEVGEQPDCLAVRSRSVGSDLRRCGSVCPWQDSNLQPAV
jgi:hypothetical protein